MREITREEAIELHRKMWSWIAKKTKEREEVVHFTDYFAENNIFKSDTPAFQCYCCEFSEQKKEYYCGHHCIINWKSPTGGCYDGGQNLTYYKRWLFCKDWAEAAVLAGIIANLPERGGSNGE